MIRNKRLDQKGLTLIELLAVLVIIGIISTIAVISISRVMADAKDRAFVGNAYALRDAGNLYLKQKILDGNGLTENITYSDLYDSDYIDEIKDPDTGRYLSSSNPSYIQVSGEMITGVCFIGEERNLCTYKGVTGPIPVKDLSVELIQNN
jgi:type IV pilus assembly protein PilA